MLRAINTDVVALKLTPSATLAIDIQSHKHFSEVFVDMRDAVFSLLATHRKLLM